MGKFRFISFYILIVLPYIGNAQDNQLDLSIGFREEKVVTQVVAGNIQRIVSAEPLLDVRWSKKLKSNWQITSGLVLQSHTNRTSIENGIDLNAQLNFHVLPVVLFGVNRQILSTERLDLWVGFHQQFVLILNRDQVIGSKQGVFKTESVRKFRSINPISQISTQLNYKFKKYNRYLFVHYGYNVGWFDLLERDVTYSLNSRTGQAIMTTRGTGLQSRFGLGFSF